MNDISKEIVATSKPFRFVVGPDKREFIIHSALVAHQSPVLNALVNGDFNEAVNCSVMWDDIDETTFISFWQFAYTGGYDDPEEPAAAEVSAMGTDGLSLRRAQEEHEKRLRKLPTRLRREEQKTQNMILTDGEGSPLKARKSDSRPDLPVHHARVYLLGDRYGIDGLMTVSYQNLDNALQKYSIASAGARGIVDLLRLCFTGLATDRLRQLVVEYTSTNIKKLWKSVEFQDLLEDHGRMAKAIVGSLMKK